MNAKGIFGSRLIEEQMCGNMIGILLRISVSNAYLSSCLRKRFRRSKTWSPILFVLNLKGEIIMFTKNDRKMLDCNKRYIEYLSRSYDSDNDYLKRKYDDLWDRATNAERENISLRTKVDLYEKCIQKITDATNVSNDVFMFDGEIYKLTERTIHEEAGMPKIMSADFQCMTGFTKNFKEE